MDEMNSKLPSSKGETKLKFNRTISIICDDVNYHRQSGNQYFEEDPFNKKAQAIVLIMHDGLKMMKFCWAKPKLKIRIVVVLLLNLKFQFIQRGRNLRFYKNPFMFYLPRKWLV